MIPQEAISFFADQVEIAVKSGHTISEVEASAADDGGILVVGLAEGGSVLASVIFPSPGWPLGEVERAFGCVAGTVLALRRAAAAWAISVEMAEKPLLIA